MRLIDADELIASLNDWRKNWEESEDSYEKTWTLTAIDFMTSLVDEKKTAYDAEAVVAELEKFKELPCGCCGLGCGECEYLESCLTGEEGYKVALDRAIEIVRGKE